jgi:undecaprenyl pyrophosphate phosphatase UppP
MAAIWVNVILGVIAAVTGGLAGHLAAQNKFHKWAFWSAALISVGLLMLQGVLVQRDVASAEQRGRR